MKNVDKLIQLFSDFKPARFDKSSWQSPHSIVKAITKPFDAQEISKRVAKKRGISQEEVLAEWKREGEIALEKGNIVHDSIERGFERSMKGQYIEDNVADRLVDYAKNYISDRKARCITREKLLTYENERLFGFLDYLIWSEKDDKLILVDWKTNKEIDRYNQWENFKNPLSNIDASKANIYSLQISFYKYMILNIFGIDIDEMHIVWLNENNKNYEVIEAVDMTKSLVKILSTIK